MIKIPESADLFAPVSPHTDVPHTIWGQTALALHDAFWRSRGISVVRRGAPLPFVPDAPCLLLEPHDLILLSPNRLTDELRRARAAGLSIRLVCHDDEHYSESVVAEFDGRFRCIERRYQPRTHRTSWGVITSQLDLVRAWAAAPNLADALRAVRAIADRGRITRATERGRLWDDTIPLQRAHFLALLQQRWRGAIRVFTDIIEVRPGVVAHRSASIDPGACLMGPVWIGANVHVPADAAIVGPHIEPDIAAPRVPEQRPHAHPHAIRPAFSAVQRRHHPSDALKRAFDIVFSLFAILLTAPLYPVVLTLIAIEDGWPFFFVHQRQTVGGREFGCIKFRTMFKDAEARKSAIAHHNHADGPQFYIPDDPRILPVGRVLRKLQLDELPQFFNVLKGDMSVVGPRPSPDKENQCCPPWREARLSVKPGITGLWQVRRTREPQIDFQEWIRYDLEYVQKRSFWLDLKIIALTVRIMFRGALPSLINSSEKESSQ